MKDLQERSVSADREADLRAKIALPAGQGALAGQSELSDHLLAENAELTMAANRDKKTGLWNRDGWESMVYHMFDYVEADGSSGEDAVYVLFVDIDKFKEFNSKYTYAGGDAALKSVAHILANNVRDYDIVGRWGGEEFVIALYGLSQDDAAKKAEAVRKAVESHDFVYEDQHLSLTVSVGVSPQVNSFDEVLSAETAAGEIMTQAKNADRRNTVSVVPEHG